MFISSSCSRVNHVPEHISEALVSAGAILPALAVPASTRISDSLKRVQGHSSPVNYVAGMTIWLDETLLERNPHVAAR